MEFLEVPLFDDDLFKLLFRFGFNVLFLVLCTALAIYPSGKKREFVFAAVMMNIMVFFICFTLKKLELELGMALGLFAIFGVLRYRTAAIETKEMSYLFVVIGIAVINALSNKKTSYIELVTVNSLIVCSALIMERFDVADRLGRYVLGYDNVELLRPENRIALFADLKRRTGLDVSKVTIKEMNVRKSTATLIVTYHLPKNGIETTQQIPIVQLPEDEIMSDSASANATGSVPPSDAPPSNNDSGSGI